MNNVAQWTAVGLILVVAVVAIFRRFTRGGKTDSCGNCPQKCECLKKHGNESDKH